MVMVRPSSNGASLPTIDLVDAFCGGLRGQNLWRYRSVLQAFAADYPHLPADEREIYQWVAHLEPVFGGDPLSVVTRRDYHQRLRTFYDWCMDHDPRCRALPRVRPQRFARVRRRQVKPRPSV